MMKPKITMRTCLHKRMLAVRERLSSSRFDLYKGKGGKKWSRSYLIHFVGWSSRHDEWLDENRMHL